MAGSLLGPSNLGAGDLHELSLGVAADTTGETEERNGTLVVKHVLKVALGSAQAHAVDGSANFTALLEVHAKVGTAALGGCSMQQKYIKAKNENNVQ